MKQYEAVIKVMEENKGFATFAQLYERVPKLPDVDWKTKTPFASIRRIVQDDRFFFKLRPGLWALKSHKDILPDNVNPSGRVPAKTEAQYTHSYYQGLITEIGNMKNYETAVPAQDKNKLYLNRTLGLTATIREIYRFSYEHIVKKACTVDVIWFNNRKMPDTFFEIEHTTTMEGAISKFTELRDFYAGFFIVADGVREKEFLRKLSLDIFKPVSARVRFLSYDYIADWHSKASALKALGGPLNIRE